MGTIFTPVAHIWVRWSNLPYGLWRNIEISGDRKGPEDSQFVPILAISFHGLVNKHLIFLHVIVFHFTICVGFYVLISLMPLKPFPYYMNSPRTSHTPQKCYSHISPHPIKECPRGY